MRRSIASRRALAVLALSLSLVAFPLGVLASHQYSDVPDSNPFHGDIAAITNAGVTSGCGGGNYCPDRNVTRAEMAAFMNRLGALAANKTPVVNATKLDGLDSSQLARVDQTQHYNCSGYDMRSGPVFIDGGASQAYYTGIGQTEISCAVHLPDGATVTGFSARVIDSTASYQVTCWLWRVDSSGGITYPSTLTSGIVAVPGLTTLVDNSVELAVIDNVGYTYTADCTLNGSAGEAISVLRVTITYTGAP